MQKNLYRSCKNQIFGGVSGGIGNYFEVDPVFIRLAFVITAFMGGLGVALYLIAWVIVPLDPSCKSDKSAQDEIEQKAKEVANEFEKVAKERKGGDGKVVLGLILLILGLMFLFQNLFNVNVWHNFWPLVLVIIGFIVIINSLRK